MLVIVFIVGFALGSVAMQYERWVMDTTLALILGVLSGVFVVLGERWSRM